MEGCGFAWMGRKAELSSRQIAFASRMLVERREKDRLPDGIMDVQGAYNALAHNRDDDIDYNKCLRRLGRLRVAHIASSGSTSMCVCVSGCKLSAQRVI